MPYLTDKDYQKLSEAIADDMVQGEIPLNDSVAKLAAKMELNQEQVQRLCEASNNTTFNKLFKSKDKTAADRFVEFTVADASKILHSQIKEASLSSSNPVHSDLRELRPLARPEESFTKTASFDLRPESRGPTREQDIRTLNKTLEHMRHEKIAADLEYHDTVHKLRSRFRRIYDVEPFEIFEKNAAAYYGVDAITPLSEIRQLLALPEVTYNFGVLTKTAGYIDASSSEMQLFGRAIKYKARSNQLSAGIVALEGVL